MACVQDANSSHRIMRLMFLSIFIGIMLLEVMMTNIIVQVTASSSTILNQQIALTLSNRIRTRSTKSTFCINCSNSLINNNRRSSLLLFHYPQYNHYSRQQQQQDQQHCSKSRNLLFLTITNSKQHQSQRPITTRSTTTSCQVQQQQQEIISTTTPPILNDDLNNVIDQQDDQQQQQKQQRGIGIIVLLTVPLAWGTYAPVIKYLYLINPPIPGFIFSSAYYIVAALTLWIVSLIQLAVVSSSVSSSSQSSSSSLSQNQIQKEQIQNVQIEQLLDKNNSSIQLTSSLTAATGVTLPENYSTTNKLPLNDDDTIENQSIESSSSSSSTLSNTVNYYSKTIQGGIELGSYLFIGNLLQVIGLKTVPADRAGFLVQLTTIFVPLLQAIYNQSLSSIPVTTWIACGIAFIGVLILQSTTITIDSIVDIQSTIVSLFSSTTATATASNAVDSLSVVTASTVNDSSTTGTSNSNDILIVLAAIFYSFHVVRLGQYATKTNPLQLATAKATTEAILSTSLVLLLLLLFPTTATTPVDFVTGTTDSTTITIVQLVQQQLYEFSSEITIFLQSIASSTMNNNDIQTFIGCVLWTGWVTCAYTIYAQSFGQRRVNSTDANLIYTIQPIFTSIFAYILVGDTLGPSGFIGGTFIAIALYIVATSKV